MASVFAEPIQYYLNLSSDLLHLNQTFGKTFTIRHIGYQCVECGQDKPIFRMGFCKNCFFESPFASDTIIRPELSTAHLGIEERNLEVEKKIQLQPHIVYLAYTGDVKVGVTREPQIPTRWIDQGATLALPIAKTTNRYEAGVIEVQLKEHLNDKTNYKKMLSNNFEESVNLADFRDKMQPYFPKEFQQFYRDDADLVRLEYPYQTPQSVNVFTLERKPQFKGGLKGIKGQYLHFDGDEFINIRNHEGYVIELEIN